MSEDRYYVEREYVLDRLQPELCCPFGNARCADLAFKRHSTFEQFAWVKKSSMDDPLFIDESRTTRNRHEAAAVTTTR